MQVPYILGCRSSIQSYMYIHCVSKKRLKFKMV